MKRVFITSLSTITLIALAPWMAAVPVVAHLEVMDRAIAQTSPNQKPQVQLLLTVQKRVVQKVQGKSQETWQALQDKQLVQPGDVLRYTIVGVNHGQVGVRNLKIVQPIPQKMVYVLNSASVTPKEGVKITYSIDGGRKFVENPTVTVNLPNGKTETRPAPANVYTHIRWNFQTVVAAKATVQGSYVVKVK